MWVCAGFWQVEAVRVLDGVGDCLRLDTHNTHARPLLSQTRGLIWHLWVGGFEGGRGGAALGTKVLKGSLTMRALRWGIEEKKRCQSSHNQRQGDGGREWIRHTRTHLKMERVSTEAPYSVTTALNKNKNTPLPFKSTHIPYQNTDPILPKPPILSKSQVLTIYSILSICVAATVGWTVEGDSTGGFCADS